MMKRRMDSGTAQRVPTARRLAVSLVASSLIAGAAAAQSVDGAAERAPAPAPPAAPITSQVSKELQDRILSAAAQGVARVARYDLFMCGSADERDYWIAAELLQIAADLDPKDTDILRLLIEARGGASQTDQVQALSRRLLALDPADTVAQLRVISTDVAQRHSTVEERLAAYDRFLGPAGASLDASVRSRLALDAALLSREAGDLKSFAARLKRAVELDSTNKDAATLALAFFSENVEDPAGKFDLMVNVLKADPLDQDVYLAIARELSVNGAFQGAERFYGAYQRVCQLKQLEIDNLAHNEILVLSWILSGSETFVRGANDSLEQMRADAMNQREQLRATGAEEDQLPDPSKQHLPLDTERLRVLAAISTGKKELIDASVRELGLTVEQSVQDILLLREQKERGMDEAAVREFLRVLKQESTWLRLWAGVELDQAARDLIELRGEPGTDPRDVKRMETWMKLRRGQLDEAESDLNQMGDEVLAQVGLGVIMELRGRAEEAIAQYRRIAERVPGAPAGAFALSRAKALIASTGSKQSVQPTDLARKLDSAALAVPSWLEGMLDNPMEFMTLRAELVAGTEGRLDLFDKMLIRVRLRNVSRVPLALGADAVLNSRMLLVPAMRAGTTPVQRPGMHAVASLDRRIRLMPREELTVDVWPDNGVIGMLMQENLRDSMSVNWRVLQGFFIKEGMYQEGAQCLSADVGTAVRPALTLALATPAELVKVIDTGTPLEVATAVLAFRDQVGTGKSEGRMSRTDAETVLDALMRRFSALDRAGKLLLLAMAPNGSAMTALTKLDELARRDRDPVVVRFAMMTRTPGADAEVLQDSAWKNDPEMLATAQAVRGRLEANKRTYARPRLPEDVEESAAGVPGAPATP